MRLTVEQKQAAREAFDLYDADASGVYSATCVGVLLHYEATRMAKS